MKIPKWLLFLLVLSPLSIFAAEAVATAPPEAAQPLTWAQGLIAAVVPVILGLFRLVWARIPKVLIPVLAPVLGAGIDLLLTKFGMANSNGILGAFFGAAGVGVREILNQGVKSTGLTGQK